MADKLKIYACSGIGEAQADAPVRYWTDGTNTISNTQAVNTILAKINLLYIQATRLNGLSQKDKIHIYNEIDLLSVALDLLRRYKDDADMMQRAGVVLSVMVHNGDFHFENLDTDQRSDHLDNLITKANDLCNDGMDIHSEDATVVEWWQKNIIARNKVGFNFGEQQKIRKAMKKAVSGIGAVDPNWQKDADLAEYLTKGSEYFLYLYFTDAQLAKLPYVFSKKAKRQLGTYNYCKDLFVGVYGSETEMQDIIRAGIIDYFQETPEQVCDDIIAGKRDASEIGAIAATALVAIINGVFALVTGIIVAICTMVAQTKVAEYQAIDQQAINASTPNGDDFDGLGFGSKTQLSSLLPLAAIVGGVVLFANFK